MKTCCTLICRITLLCSLLITTHTMSLPAVVTPDCLQTAQPLDTLTLTTDLGDLLNVDEQVEGEWVVVTFGLTGGTTVVALDPESVSFMKATGNLDTIPLPHLFDALALESVRLAVDSGLITTSQNPSNPMTVDVYIPTCVWVAGSGTTTSYTNVDECIQGVRTVTYSGSGTGWTGGITELDGTTSCSSGTATIDGGWYLN